jgi:microcystin-dependent protein
MADPFLAEIRIFPFNFAPTGWAFCNGQIMPIAQNTAVFSLLGTSYGGDGRTTFGLPNLQGSVPIHVGGMSGAGPGLSDYVLGEIGGTEAVTLASNWFPAHNHLVYAQATDAGDNRSPKPTLSLAKSQSFTNATTPQAQLDFTGIGQSGGGSAHNNMMPGLVVNFCIALQGIFPSRN